ncbi:hypothetical protein Hamer_G024361 [Homarus americanus]|uniref:Uncharacterized protein n=1 Tax=Homarus americanus TaxID=6706 RepID=A0A8J5NGR2_HOMAM|nr:hypothetical protein Hamer_G024361 [Homarus americanus]
MLRACGGGAKVMVVVGVVRLCRGSSSSSSGMYQGHPKNGSWSRRSSQGGINCVFRCVSTVLALVRSTPFVSPFRQRGYDQRRLPLRHTTLPVCGLVTVTPLWCIYGSSWVLPYNEVYNNHTVRCSGRGGQRGSELK